MTKNILLGLGATAALVGASFAIVSCANEKTPEKTEATITFNPTKFKESKVGVSDQATYLTEIVTEANKEKLNAIFTSEPEGAISEIKVENSDSGKNVKFTLIANDGFSLSKEEFVIVYNTASPATEATITFNQEAFETSKNDIGSIDDYVTKYSDTNISAADKETLDAIFTSNPEGAIDSITVAKVDADNVTFTLTTADGFTLDKDTFDIVYNHDSTSTGT